MGEIELFTCGTLHFKNELENILVTKLDFFILENFFWTSGVVSF